MRAVVRSEQGPALFRRVPGLSPHPQPRRLDVRIRSLAEWNFTHPNEDPVYWESVRGRSWCTSLSSEAPQQNWVAEHPPLVVMWFPEMLHGLLIKQSDGTWVPSEITRGPAEEFEVQDLFETIASGDRHRLVFEPDRGLITEWSAYADDGELIWSEIVETLEFDAPYVDAWPEDH